MVKNIIQLEMDYKSWRAAVLYNLPVVILMNYFSFKIPEIQYLAGLGTGFWSIGIYNLFWAKLSLKSHLSKKN